MKKEKFLFELVDNYLYVVNLGCIALENYYLEDKTDDYTNCANCLEDCLDFFDQIYSSLDDNKYSPYEVDAILSHLVQTLKEQTVRDIIIELNKIVNEQLPGQDDFVDKHLLLNKEGNPQALTARTLQDFFIQLRIAESI